MVESYLVLGVNMGLDPPLTESEEMLDDRQIIVRPSGGHQQACTFVHNV